MKFKEKYIITSDYLTTNTKRRSGKLIYPTVKFVVLHDTGNLNSTASGNIKYYKSTDDYQSAHIFVDDKGIVECIPALTSDKPEKAWHVRYDKQKDNELFGHDANDTAIGIEYCYGNNINSDESYKRYVWVVAYICYKFNLDPRVSITAHYILDPGRRTDPISGLKHSNRTYDQLLQDIVSEYKECKDVQVKKPDAPPSDDLNSKQEKGRSSKNIWDIVLAIISCVKEKMTDRDTKDK